MTSRRSFLAGAGAAFLAPAARAAATPRRDEGQYVVGVVANPAFGRTDDVELKVYVCAGADGSGFGLLADRVDATNNCHLAVQTTAREGRRYRWQGVVAQSNNAALVGKTFSLVATVRGDSASQLELVLGGVTFDGSGVTTTTGRSGF
jgi:hypothetical protein